MENETNWLGYSKKYGMWGDEAIKEWTYDYERIRKDVKFGGEDNEAFLVLMQKINDRMNREVIRRSRWNKVGIAMVLVSILMLWIASSMGDNGLVLPVVSIAVTVVVFMMKKCCEKVLMAAIDFDETYFDGEIVYRRKNG